VEEEEEEEERGHRMEGEGPPSQVPVLVAVEEAVSPQKEGAEVSVVLIQGQ
jgi:hypothetical protein